ncbi:MAG: hypothetical protein RIF33_03095 [Cyclobacteriaceae bacterium]
MIRCVLILLLLLPTVSAFAQNSSFSSVITNPSFFYLGGTGSVAFNLDQNSRHGNFFYNDYKVDNLQVVSVHQPQVQQDLVYYIDQQGNTLYRSYAPTAPINMGLTNNTGRDSFNPYGARDIGESLFTGVLNTLFSNKRVRFLNR